MNKQLYVLILVILNSGIESVYASGNVSIVKLYDFDTALPSIMVFKSGETFSAPARKGQGKQEYNKQVKSIGDVIYDYTRKPNLVVTSRAYRILSEKEDLTRLANKLIQYAENQNEVISGDDLSVGKRLLLKTAQKDYVLAEILSIDNRMLVFAYVTAANKKPLFSNRQITSLMKTVEKNRIVEAEVELWSMQTSVPKGINVKKNKAVTVKSSDGNIIIDAEYQKKVENLVARKADLVFFHKPQNVIYAIDADIIMLGRGKLADFSEKDLTYRIHRSNRFLTQISPESVLLLKRKDNTYALLRVLEQHEKSVKVHWIYQPNGTAIFPRIKEERSTRDLVSQSNINQGLSNAAMVADSAEVKRLIAANANINIVNQRGFTALQEAIIRGDLRTVKLLLSAGADTNIANQEGWSALHVATRKGRLDIVKAIVEAGADLTLQTKKGETALSISSDQYGNKQIRDYLLSIGIKPNSIYAAAQVGDIETVNSLVAQQADINQFNQDGKSALHIAAEAGNSQVINILLKNGADPELKPEKRGGTAIEIAASHGHVDAVKELLEVSDGRAKASALNEASMRGYAEVVDELLESKVDPNVVVNNYLSPYELAMQSGTEQVAEAYARHGYEIPLWAAARLGKLELVEEKVASGIDINAQTTSKGQSALELAIKAKQVKVTDYLLGQGAGYNAVSPGFEKNTMMHLAVEAESLDLVKKLTEGGANINIQNTYGRTPLYEAVVRSQNDVIQYLLTHKANPNMLPPGIKSLSEATSNEDTQKLLQSFGVN